VFLFCHSANVQVDQGISLFLRINFFLKFFWVVKICRTVHMWKPIAVTTHIYPDFPLAASRCCTYVTSQNLKSLREPCRKSPMCDRFPVVVFSHGLAACRTTYSCLLTDLASQVTPFPSFSRSLPLSIVSDPRSF
jgi:hypothetical protein